MFGWYPGAAPLAPEQGKIVLAIVSSAVVGGIVGYYAVGTAAVAPGIGVALFLLAVGYCLRRPQLQIAVVIQGNLNNVNINLPPDAPLLTPGMRGG